MRLGWVVGQAGIIGAIGVIMIAHVISLSTGLSISSIATDKKIKTGGIYYVLSRSLGLPMGGAIGIALFIGTALSISLYIVGFGESFLGIEAISEFLGLSPDVSGYRILGTGVILFLVIIALISTSFALKTQFIILGAILLSLISIFLGFFLNTDFHPEVPNIKSFADGVPLEVVFAIFFPAVTGFTAGVAMSGDLNDPKKSIPKGTMASIIVGLVVYITLAIGIGLFVDRDILLSDNNFLMKIAFFAPLVVAGIWGATLSSALGGILGGPRILQAMSIDKITPNIFGKGSGINNEPRNALIFTFLIAEGGILIGELNVIARIVSMFYIAAYGFINLAFALESWASSDFRPGFKVSRWIGVIGFIACFAVMFKLDTLAMVLAFIAIGGIYFLLQRKQIRLEFGDVWQSVKTNIVRRTLHDLNKGEIEQRNWQPNIILFSGSLTARPYLIDFGKYLVGRHGFVSVFEIVEHKDADILIPRHKQSVTSDESTQHEGVFTRRYSYHDLYEGIETIAGTYGFSGIEPNTVLMGWARQKKNPEKFARMLTRLEQLDMNIIMMDYDKKTGFGKKQHIDIWWRKTEPMGILSLNLARFLLLSEEWRNARIRLLIVNDKSEERAFIHNNTRDAINNLRIQAEIRIIDNESANRSFYEIIKNESVNSDLIMLGAPEMKKGEEKKAINKINTLCEDLGTVAILKASSYFKSLQVGYKEMIQSELDLSKQTTIIQPDFFKNLPVDKPLIVSQLKKLLEGLNKTSMQIFKNHFLKAIDHQKNLSNNISQIILKGFEKASLRAESQKNKSQQMTTNFIFQNILLSLQKEIIKYRDESLKIQKDLLFEGIQAFISEMEQKPQKSPENIYQYLTLEDLIKNDKDSRILKRFKARKRFLLMVRRKPVSYKILYRKLIASYIPFEPEYNLNKALIRWEIFTHEYTIHTENLLNSLTSAFEKIEIHLRDSTIIGELISEEQTIITNRINTQQQAETLLIESIENLLISKNAESIQDISEDLQPLNANHYIKARRINKGEVANLKNTLQIKPGQWAQSQTLFYNALTIKIQLASFRNVLKAILHDVSKEINELVENSLSSDKEKLINKVDWLLQEFSEDKSYEFQFGFDYDTVDNISQQLIENSIRKITNGIRRLNETSIISDDYSSQDNKQDKVYQAPTYEISIRLLVDYIIQNEIVAPVRGLVSETNKEILTLSKSLMDTHKIITLTMQETEDEGFEMSSLSAKEKLNIIKEQHEILISLSDKLQKIKDFTELKIYDLTNEVENKITLYALKENISNKKQYIRREDIEKKIPFIKSNIERVSSGISHLANQFWYRQSKGLILASALKASRQSSEGLIDSIHNLNDQVSIDPILFKKLPFYYQQLFLRKQSYLNEFWVERKKETLKAARTVDRYKSGYTGGLMILGEEESGKTFFSNYISNTFFINPSIYRLNAPGGGSIDPKIFIKLLQRSTNLKGNVDEIFSRLPENSIIIINNLELWWEKSEDGTDVIELIHNIINNYSNRCFFIVNTNFSSFSFINKIRNIETAFLNFIELAPLNAEQLKDLIMKRHKSGTLSFQTITKEEQRFQSYDYAKLFSKYFNFTKGNPGMALRAWIANITDFENNTVNIKLPRTPDLEVLDRIDTEWYIIILNFVLHKRLSLERLVRITKEEKEVLSQRIGFMKRAGILQEYSEGVYYINEFLYPYLKEKLIEKEML